MAVATPVIPDSTGPQSGTQYKVNIDANGKVDSRLAWAFAPHEQATPDMTVRLEAGFIPKAGAKAAEVAAQSTGIITAPSVNPRNDIVHIDAATGAGDVATGAENASPVDPAVPAGKVAVGRIRFQTSTTTITNSILDDLRNPGFLGLGTAAALSVGLGLRDNSGALDLDINGLAAITAPAKDDLLAFRDTSLGGPRKMTFENWLKVVAALTEDTTPDSAADFLLSYDASAAAARKVKMDKIGGGKIGQVVTAVSATEFSITSRIPFDTSKPQSGEGVEIITLAITPANASSTLLIDISMPYVWLTGDADFGIWAMFKDTGANAIDAGIVRGGDSGFQHHQQAAIAHRHVISAGSTSAQTFKIRVGRDGTTDTIRINRDNAGTPNDLGNAQQITMTITEVLP